MSSPEQEGLFYVPPPAPLAPRVEFLAGLLATWTLGDRKPPPLVRRQFEELAAQTLGLAATIGLQVANEKPAKSE